MDAKEYIKQKLKKYDSTIDTSPGSPIGDLFVNPLSAILQETLDLEDYMLNSMSLKNPESLTESEVDGIASNFLIERITGSKASGNIRLYYSAPISLTVPKGSMFQNTTGKNYVTTRTFSITRQLMLLNNENYPLYHTGDIPIEAAAEGLDYITRANTVTKAISSISPIPTAIKNLQAITGGIEKESNAALKEKVLNHSTNKSLASPDGIKRTLLDSFSSITSLTVKGNGDTEMIRDITYSGVELDNVYTSDFSFVVSGLHTYPYNESIAYVGRFADTDETTVVALPDPADFTYEFTNDMYKGLFRDDDAVYSELATYNILEENFNNTETSTGYSTSWVASDGQYQKGGLINPDEITVSGQALKLGTREDPILGPNIISSDKPLVLINVSSFNSVASQLRNLINEEMAAQEESQDTPGGGGAA